MTSQYMATSQRIDLVRVFPADSQFPIGNKLIAMEFNPSLNQPKLFAREFSGQNFTISKANRGLEFSIFRMNVRQVVVQVVEQIQSNDDPVKLWR